ncbi:mycofactocin oligosaccharide methyltransferase MftM [Allosalinactinospora lopnorensis]|uniref:mycofactocin oligosaccharide methyltransferase MftM n=1 Tax=Allosalinactinospora lopnorensis TaxID=1352348 RepID=UPI000623E62B|nr:mycofactocin oligosaccharide methyltransferase MftM [Allosalinactinospora lopnorensis]
MSGVEQLSGSTRIDPFADSAPGHYSDGLIMVVHERCPATEAGRPPIIARTPHFCLRRSGHRVRLSHRIPPERLDNDLAGMLTEELFTPGWLSGAEVFERIFTGIVRSTVDDPVRAWSVFYDNTLRRIRDAFGTAPGGTGPCHSSIAAMAPVYERVLRLVPEGRVLDIGSCFGFLALLLAERPETSVIASDIADGTVSLLRAIARARGLPMGAMVCDGARVPLPDRAVDTVTVVHLLEHLSPEHGAEVVDEALRLARRRVIVAVPYEDVPNAAYGHVRTFTPDDLERLGKRSGLPYRVDEHHGGWLVVDRS